MLKPERVTFSVDDDQFQQFTTPDQLESYLNDSLVHYSTDFKKIDKQEVAAPVSIRHSNSLDKLPSTTMSSQDQQQQQQTEHEPPASAPPSLISEEVPILNENNLRQFDALTLRQLAIGSNQTSSSNNEESTKISPSHSASLADIQKEIDRVKQMKYGRTYSSPTSSLCSRLSINPFNGSNHNIDLSSVTQSVHFTDQENPTNRLPFSSTFITSIPESIVPASGTSSTNENHFIPIHHLESPSLEDREVFETFHTKQTSMPGVAIRQSANPLNRKLSTSETDILASLHRSASKQALDNQSDHGTTYSGASDDMIFVEWDKERSLFQDYINSLRTEIRVLLQERSEYQKQMETINSNLGEHKRLNLTQINADQTKYDLLQKSLEEKNLVLEQLQKEYEVMKEKNNNLTRKVSNLRCDAKSQTGVIDELKQKIAELTVDIQNHVLVKRRLEIAMMNLESDCQIIDAERLRLNHEIKDTFLSKQDLEKLLQQANVQIAEQGSAIEMLRSDNIQVRSQLSATQRRMLQEKQQVMDYLRQIENDLVEKEQIKQRESILRKDYEKLQSLHQQDRQAIDQLNSQINQDKQKLTQLEQERLQLLKTIQNVDDKQVHLESELDSYKSATKRLYTHFKIPFDSIQSIDQLIPMLEDRYRTEQIAHAHVHQIPLVQSAPQVNTEQETEEIRRLREELATMNVQLRQLDEANQAWQQYQQNQLVLLRDRLKITETDNLSFEDIVQQIENRFIALNDQLIEFQDVQNNRGQSRETQTEENEEDQRQREHHTEEIPVQNVASDGTQHEEELRILRAECAQLDEANRAWKLYHQTQLDSFRDILKNSLSIEDSPSLDDIAQQIATQLDQLRNEREGLVQQLQTSEKRSHDLRSKSATDDSTAQQAYVHKINELNEQLRSLKQHNDQLETEKYVLNQQLEKQSSFNSNQERNTPTPDSTASDSKLLKKQAHPVQIHEVQIHNVIPVQSASPLINEHEQELQQLRENLALLTTQCAQLDEANRAWQLYQQSQIETFRDALQHHLPIDHTSSLEQAAQQILEQITKEREDFTQQYLALEKLNDELRSDSMSQMETIDELNQELLAMKEKDEQMRNDTISSDALAKPFDEVPKMSSESADEEEVRQLRESLKSLTAQLDETNRAWKEYQQTQAEILRSQLENCLSIEYDSSFDEIAQQIVDQVTREREDSREKYQALERANHDLQSESRDNMESIRQSYINTVNELNQELLAMKEAYEQLDSEKQNLVDELEKRMSEVNSEQMKSAIVKTPSAIIQQPFEQVPIHSSNGTDAQETQEVHQLRESVVALTAQCAQLDEANRAWQLYHQAQFDNFQAKLHDHFPIDGNTSFDEIAQQIIDQVTREREDSREKYEALESVNADLPSNDDLQSIRQTYGNTINQLNQQLLAMKEAYDQLDTEKQVLVGELEKRSVETDRYEVKRTTEKVPSDIWNQAFKEVPIHSSSASDEQQEEVRQLRENVATLTAQCSQLDEANRAWQLYQQTQLDNFRTKLHDHLLVDDNASFDQIAEQIITQVTSEREDFSEKYQALEKTNNDLPSVDDLESIRQSYTNTVNALNQELLAMKEAYDRINTENQDLATELEKRAAETEPEQLRQASVPEKVPSDLFQQPFAEVPIHATSATIEQDAEELQQLREKVILLTTQCAQLDEVNRAWQLYQQSLLDNIRNKLAGYLPIDDNASMDEISQQFVDQIIREREEFNHKFQAVEKTNDEIRSESASSLEAIKQSYINTVNELNQELLAMKEAYDQLDTEKQALVGELEKRSVEIDRNEVKRTTEKVPSDIWNQQFKEVPIHTSGADVERETEELLQLRESVAALTAQCAQLDEANRAWQLYQQSQLDNFRAKLQDYLPVNESATLDDIAQQIADQMTKEREDVTERYTDLEKLNDDLRSESATNLETIKQTYMNTVNELNQELLVMKEAYDQLDSEKQALVGELEKRSVEIDRNEVKRTTEKVPSDIWNQAFKEVPVHSSSASDEQQEEVRQLRENVATLTAQCSQLDEANRAWQLYQQSQLDNFRAKLQDYLPVNESATLDDIAQQIADQMTKEREDVTERYTDLEKLNDDLRSESATNLETIKQSYMDTLNELNQELLALKEAYQELDAEKQVLANELEKRSTESQLPPLNLAAEAPLQTSSVPVEEGNDELQQLQENFTLLTSQYAQLNEANQAWQTFHQSQLENFRTKVQPCLPLDDDVSFDQIAQQIVDQLTKEREDFAERYQAFERILGDLQSDSTEEKKKFLLMQEQYEEALREKAKLINQIENQEQDKQTIASTDSTLLEQETEMSQLRENLRTLTAQFDEANRSWEQFERAQLDLLRTRLPSSNKTSLEEIIQEIIAHINHLTEENDLLKGKERDLQAIKDQYEQLLAEKPTGEQVEQDLTLLQGQCTQLEGANRAWQTFYENQIDLLKEKFQDHIQFDENPDFEQIIQLIATALDSNETIPLKQQISELQETNNLLMNTNQNLTYRLNQMERSSSPFVSQDNYKQARRTPIQDVPIHRLTPVQSAPPPNIGEEELQQLRTDLATLTAQCAQLDEANRAWQQYHQNELESFRKKLQNWTLFDEKSTLEQIAQEIVVHLDQLGNNITSDSSSTIESLNQQLINYQTKEAMLAQNLEQLNQKLSDVQQECEEFREHNANLISSKQQAEQQLEEYQQQNDTLQLANQRLQVELNELEQRPTVSAFQRVEPSRESVPIHNINRDREDEFRQLRNDLAAASAHCLQLEEANRAWQKYQQDQIESFRQNLQEQIPSFNQTEHPSLDSIAQQIINHLHQVNSQRDYLVHQNDSLKDEIRLQKKELERPSSADSGKRMFRRLSQDKHIREAQVHNITPVQSASPLINEHEQELQQLRENLALLTTQCAQLNEANRAWQLYQQSQIETFRDALQHHLPIDHTSSLEQAAQQILEQITKEREDFTQQYLALEKLNDELRSDSMSQMETIDELNQELLAMKEKDEQMRNDTISSDALAKPFDEVPKMGSESADEEEVRQLQESLKSLTAQLDESNRAWKEYQQTQTEILRSQLENCLSIEYDSSFDEIAQQIVDQVTREREDSREKYQALERANHDLQSDDNVESIRQSHLNTVNELNQELLAMREAYEQLDAEKQGLVSELEKRSVEIDQNEVKRTIEKIPSDIWNQPFKEVPIHTSSADVEQDVDEMQQLRYNIAALTAQCAQLDEANRAWQLYQQSQLDNFRAKLQDYLPVNESATLDDIAQQIADQMTKERAEFTESYAELEKLNENLRSEVAKNLEPTEQFSTETVDELTEELQNLRNQYEELEKMNKQLLLEKEDLTNQLNDRSIVVGHHSASESNLVESETPIESNEESELQSLSTPVETEEIRQIRSDLASVTSQLTELTQTNENELNSFRDKLEQWISLSPNSSLAEIAEQLNTQFEQQKPPIPPEATENATQTIEPPAKVHIAIETIPLTYDNHHTQIDPIDMIDEQIQTESLLHIWSMSNDDHLLTSDEDDDRLRDYIDEITSLSPLDLSHRLSRDCEQILSKQKFEKSSHPNLDLNHLALITIYSLYQQHLTDDAKQLYNDTVIRALKQEYELINNEKSDYMEKYLHQISSAEKKFHQLQNQYDDLLERNELERLESKQSLTELERKYETNLYNLHQENEQLKYNFNALEEHYRSTQEQNYKQLENEYQQLREDYNELINQNELLKDYNSQMYQTKLQDKDPSCREIDIQCDLLGENQGASWSNDWDEDNTKRDLPVQEQGLERSSNEEEINRLKAMIEEIQLENEFLKELNSQKTNTDATADQSVRVDSYAQTESDNEQISSNPDTLPEREDNDWSAQFSPLEIPSDEANLPAVTKETIDNETQTEEQPQDKLVQVNTKLKRALQNIKDRIHQAVTNRPEWFPDVGDDTIQRLDHLISAIENQATQIEILNHERENLLERNEQLEQSIQSNTNAISSDQRVFNDDSTQTDSDQVEQITKVENDEESTLANRLLNFVSNVTSTSRTSETIDQETQTDEQTHEKLAQVTNKLKRALQNIKDKIHQAVIERAELFADVGDDTIERLDHLISTVGNQAAQIDFFQNEREQAQHEINQLHSSLEASQNQVDNERPVRTEQLVSASPLSDDIRSSPVENYEKQIQHLQQKLSQNEEERSLLRERLNEVEMEFRKTFDDRASTMAMYEEQLQSLIRERDALIQQQIVQSTESQQEIEQLQQELTQFKQTPITSNEDIQSLQEVINQQAEEMRDMSEKYFALVDRADAQDEFDQQQRENKERLNNYENQIEHLIREHANLVDELQKKSSSSVQTIDNESQTDEQQADKQTQINAKLKRALQMLKEKIHRFATERPDLFANTGEETSERLDHLISTVEHQATQIDLLQAERSEVEEQLQNEIQQLQSSLEASQQQLANERPVRTEQLVSAAPSSDDIRSSPVEDYEKQIQHLQQKLSQNEEERSLLRERLNEVEMEFRKTFDDRASTMAMYEEQLQSLIRERDVLIQQQIVQSTESQEEIEQLQQELAELKEPANTQPIDTTSNEEIQSLKDEIEEKSEELRTLSEKYLTLSSQLSSNADLQTEIDRQRKEAEERFVDYENQIENLARERADLLEEIQKNASSSVQTTGDQQQDKLAKISAKLKRALQTIKEKINRIATERPDLFANISEDTSERLDHLISTVEHQATQIDLLQTERNEVEEQLQNEIRELQGSVEAYRYQIENERPVRTEQLVTAAPSSDDISPSMIEDHERQIKHLQLKLSQNEEERSLLRERLNEVELEFRKTFDDRASTMAMYEEQLQSFVRERNALIEQQVVQSAQSQQEIEQLQEELIQLKQSDQDINSLNEIIDQQSEQLEQLNEKYIAASSQLQSQTELDRQKEEAKQRLIDYENQIENLTRERANLLEEIRRNASASVPTTESEKQTTGDQQQDKLIKINTKLKRVLQIFKEKLNRLASERPDLFANVGEETSERLDHLISMVEHQATQIDVLQAERNEIEEQLRNEINELQNSFDLFRKAQSSPSALVHRIETEPTEATQEIQASQASNDNQWNDWSTDSTQRTETNVEHSTDEAEPSVSNRLFGFFKTVTSPWTEETPTNDWDEQNSPLQLPSEEPQATTSSPSSLHDSTQLIKTKLHQFISEYPNLFLHSSDNVLDNLDQLISIIKTLHNQIEELQNKSIIEEHQKQVEIQPHKESSTPADQRISRRVFEQEMLAWSKESERLKQFVKQIQIENKKLKDIILKFEPIIRDYMHENERLKQESQQFSFLSDPSTTEDSISSDMDICYLTLRWLTYEVAQRTSDHHGSSILLTDENDPYLQQRLIDTERQLKSVRIQNQKFKKQLETYTIQFKHIQHEISTKNEELSTLKSEIERLRTSETQYRLEVDRLKVDLHCDQVKFQQLERELTDLKLERTNIDDPHSANNLRELLDLKERELNALKEKLDYTIQAHQLELQEAIKANQFSLDNVQRFEQLDQRHQAKRKELEGRLGKICRIVRPLINNQYLFSEESLIDIDELQQLITDTEAEERVINSLGPIRNVLGLLESQMKELQHNLIENQTRRSKKSKYRSDFESSSDENQWDITASLPSLQEASNLFLASSPMDLIENDVRLCLDDLLDEVTVRTTVK